MELLTPTPDELRAADRAAELTLAVAEPSLSRLLLLFSRGCFVRVVTGHTVRQTLLEQLGVTPEYLEKEIKIIFLDSSPVDDVSRARVHEGATLALSAAMPGLVGAAMRRDGLSWMRSSITYQEQKEEASPRDGLIFLKLFNKVMEDLGEPLFRRGVYVGADALFGFLDHLDERFWGDARLELNGHPHSREALFARRAELGPWVKLGLVSDPSPRTP